ncbi:hypothetical protein DL771_009553 [Monosporascus sp. 5C6A]|nr:hypothetical protein DL771_009553 [Monosporascus sp. 5C6A]
MARNRLLPIVMVVLKGGRQCLVLAQHYPATYDAIIATAPAIHWAGLYLSQSWPAFFMQMTDQYPYLCELQELTSLAIAACHGLDVVMNCLIAETQQCLAVFDPFALVGSAFKCAQTGTMKIISNAATTVANASLTGPLSSSCKKLWYGADIGTDLSDTSRTTCSTNGTCGVNPINAMATLYVGFVLRDDFVVRMQPYMAKIKLELTTVRAPTF